MGTKQQPLRDCVFNVLLYACETRNLEKDDERRLHAFEMKCCRRLLSVKWFHFGTSDEIRKRVQMVDDIVTTIKKRKVQLCRHVHRMNDDRLLKVIMLGMVDGPRREWLRRAWIDVIKERVAHDGHCT